MHYDTIAKHLARRHRERRCGMKGLQIAKLRRVFGLTLQQATLVAALLYGEGAE